MGFSEDSYNDFFGREILRTILFVFVFFFLSTYNPAHDILSVAH